VHPRLDTYAVIGMEAVVSFIGASHAAINPLWGKSGLEAADDHIDDAFAATGARTVEGKGLR
jgi:hypothetical protein